MIIGLSSSAAFAADDFSDPSFDVINEAAPVESDPGTGPADSEQIVEQPPEEGFPEDLSDDGTVTDETAPADENAAGETADPEIIPENIIPENISSENVTEKAEETEETYAEISESVIRSGIPQAGDQTPGIAFFGDGITWGCDGSADPSQTVEASIPQYIEGFYNARCGNYAVEGIGWHKCNEAGLRAYHTITEADLQQYDYAAIALGLNDAEETGFYGSLDDANGAETVMGQFHECIQYMKTQNPDITIIMIAPWVTLSADTAAITALLAEGAAAYGIPFISQDDNPVVTNGVRADDLPDEIHPSQDTYNIYSEWIAGKLQGLIGLREKEPIPLQEIELQKTTLRYNGSPRTLSATAKVTAAGGPFSALKPDTDYTLSYKNNENVGTATVTAAGKGHYTGEVKTTFRIIARSLESDCTVRTPKDVYPYTGKSIKPAPVVTISINGTNTVLIKDKDYTVTYKNNVKIGEASVTVTGTGNYKGTVRTAFRISPAVPRNVSASDQKTGILTSWQKVSECDGYHVQYSISSRFPAEGRMNSLIKGNGTIKFERVMPEDGMRYFVRVRSYKTASDGTRNYSSWSSTVSAYQGILAPSDSVSGKNLLASIVKKNTKSAGCTYKWTDSGCLVKGKATASSINNLYSNTAKLPDGFVRGGRYQIESSITCPNLYLKFIWYLSDGSRKTDSLHSAKKRDVIVVPLNAVGAEIRIHVNTGKEVNGRVGTPKAYKYKETAPLTFDSGNENDVFAPIRILKNGTSAGVQYTWSASGCRVRGNSTAPSSNILCSFGNSLPSVLKAGEKYVLNTYFTTDDIYCDLVWKLSNGSTSADTFGRTNQGGVFTVPSKAVGVTIRLRVNSAKAVDGLVRIPEIYHCSHRNRTMPLIVTYLDDDASNNLYVDRYYQNCMHNGVVGNYAVITGHVEKGKTSLDRLKEYEADGFGMLIHCYEQSNSVAPEWLQQNVEACRANLEKGLEQMEEYGFRDYRYWITPGGIRYEWVEQLARDTGCKALISSGNQQYNTLYDYNSMFIKRVSLAPTDAGNQLQTTDSVKAILKNASRTGGWVIITTHFNSWDNVPWDSTKDPNGYETGYSRFNEIVRYASSLGFQNKSFQDAWALYEPIMSGNRTEYGL